MNVKELREKKGLTQSELAEKSGIPRDRIAKWEQGKGSPKAADEKILLGIFGEVVHNGSVSELEPQDGQIIKNEGMASTSQLLETINLLVRQQDKLIVSHDKIAETNRVLAGKIETIPVGVDVETQIAVAAMLQGLREFVLKIASGTRYDSLERARTAYRKEFREVQEKTKGKGIRGDMGSSHK